MSIRARLSILVSILVALSLTILGYLAAAFIETRQRLQEADAALREFELAVNTGAAIARLRLELLHHQSVGSGPQDAVIEAHVRASHASFERWLASSRASLAAGIEDEAADLKAIAAQYTAFEAELDQVTRALANGGGGPIPADLFESLLGSGIRQITEDDVVELNAALDGVLLSMGTTPWIARIGPAQLATARATLAEIRAAEEVRSHLLHQAYCLAVFLADAGPDRERMLIEAASAFDKALAAWGRTTETYARVSGEVAPPYYGAFSLRCPAYQRQIGEVLALARAGQHAEARATAEKAENLALEDELLAAVDSSLAVEVEELRTMLGNLAASTGAAGAGGIALMCTILFSVLFLFVTTARGMLRSLAQLRAGTERIGAGHFGHRLNLAGTDELGQLGAQFDAMAVKLQAQELHREALETALLRKERLATLGQVVATVSHEIRNPLGTIRTAIYSLRKRMGESGETVERTLDRAERSIVRCDRIIEELLSYTRTQEPDRTETALDPWLSEVLDDFTLPPGIDLVRRLESGATVWIDRNRLQGCVVNLLSNACQSMLERAAGATGGTVQVETCCEGDRILIRVTDTGPGMAPAVLAQVFEPMFSTRSFGAGLGLPIVRKYMEQHEGGVDIASTAGHGTVATLWLKAPKQEETHA